MLDFEGTDFKSGICFRKFWAQILKFEHFGPKGSNFLVLKKIFSVRYFEDADLKPDIRFLWFLTA